METAIRNILKRGIFTLVSIFVIILLNAYLDSRYQTYIILQTKQQNMTGPVYTERNERPSAVEIVNLAIPDHKSNHMIDVPDEP